jgi:hypothetical protein
MSEHTAELRILNLISGALFPESSLQLCKVNRTWMMWPVRVRAEKPRFFQPSFNPGKEYWISRTKCRTKRVLCISRKRQWQKRERQ